MKTYLNRNVVKEIEFIDKGTFEAYRKACNYLTENGFNYGSTCALEPMGFMKREWNCPWKWKNMTPKQRNSVDGVVVGDLREGPVKLIFFNE
jgi:hypothetical protein